jgi:tetratricopeptide (TPR) repeat protein
MKLRVLLRGRLVSEQDLPGIFNAEYFPEDRRSEAALKRLYDNDYHFRNRLLGERLHENKRSIRRLLFSEYGYGMQREGLDIGYVKDRKGIYSDLSKALSLMNEALKGADNKKDYLDDVFAGKVNEAITIYHKALEEASDDKKARIDPKVSTLIHYNLALAFYGLQKYDDAQSWLAKATSGEGPAKGRAQYLENRIANKIRRLNAREISVDESLPMESGSPTLMNDSSDAGDFIILKSGDSVKVKFLMPSRETMPYGDSVWLQDKIIVWNNNKRMEATARELVGYSYNGVYRHAIRSTEDGSSVPPVMSYKFCKMVESGAISVYDCYNVEPSFRDATRLIVATQGWYTKGEDTFKVMFLNFNRGVSKLVEDYPDLAEKVRGGTYEREDFNKVVREYNQWAATQKK